jgi:hypothetical protein
MRSPVRRFLSRRTGRTESLVASRKLDWSTLYRLAALASADPRSIQKEYLNPGSVRGAAGYRIRAVLTELKGSAP